METASSRIDVRPIEFRRQRTDKGQRCAVIRAIYMMRERLSEPLTIDDLADYAFFSKYHFTRVFHRYTGMSPGKFLAELRMMSAQHLLVTSDLSFTEITFRVGYTSIGSFSARFKVVIGLPPSEYRRRVHPAESPFSAVSPTRQRSVIVRHWLSRVESAFGPQERLAGWSTAVPYHGSVRVA